MSSNILAVDGRSPAIDGGAWVAPTATVVGSATIAAGTGIFYGAVIRADIEDISVGEGSNVQDTAVVHADPGGAGQGAPSAHAGGNRAMRESVAAKG